MRYNLMVRSRVQPNIPIEEKHQRFFNKLRDLQGSWKPVAIDIPVLPKIGTGLLVKINLTNYFSKWVRGYVCYQLRNCIEDSAVYDDFMSLNFNPEKIDYYYLVNEVIPFFIEAFQAYLIQIEDFELINKDFEESRKIDSRFGVYRICSVNFFDEILCNRAFNYSPEEIVSKLNGQIEKIKFQSNGVFIVATSKSISSQKAEEINFRLKSLLVLK